MSYSAQELWELHEEYVTCAHNCVSKVQNRDQLRQYYQLIGAGVTCLVTIKEKYSLSMEHDAQVTLALVSLLVDETADYDAAEMYISSLQERLKNDKYSDDLEVYRLVCHFMNFYTIPLKRKSQFHMNIALKNCNELVTYMENALESGSMQPYSEWLVVFKFVVLTLSILTNKHGRLHERYKELIEYENVPKIWKYILVLHYVDYRLKQRKPIEQDILSSLSEITVETAGAKLYAWRLISELLMDIYNDRNITEQLNRFKLFFKECKDKLDGSLEVNVDSKAKLQLKLEPIFHYKDLKNILLLLQSVSYLLNGYDKKANFSIKFLSKVQTTTQLLLEGIRNDSANSILTVDNKVSWYTTILKYVSFYKLWDYVLLKGITHEYKRNCLEIPQKDHQLFLELIGRQSKLTSTGGSEELQQLTEQYTDLAGDSSVHYEVKLSSLLNCYIILSSLVSEDIDKAKNISRCNDVWMSIQSIFDNCDLRDNSLWNVTILMVWIISHFEPFTANPLPSTDEEKSSKLEAFKGYYQNNKYNVIDKKDAGMHNNLKVKRGLLLHVLLNYIGARLFEQDLEEMTKISERCFRMANISIEDASYSKKSSKQPRVGSLNTTDIEESEIDHPTNMNVEGNQGIWAIRYIMGLWSLMNYTVGMRQKEVIYTRNKLSRIIASYHQAQA